MTLPTGRAVARRLIVVSVLAVSSATVAVAVASAAQPASSPPAAAGKDFTVTDIGAAAGLYPGGTAPRKVRISNPNAQDITVTTLTATVGTPVRAGTTTMSGCPASAVTVAPLATSVKVPGKGTADTTLTVRLAPAATDFCKNNTFPLTYSGKATQS